MVGFFHGEELLLIPGIALLLFGVLLAYGLSRYQTKIKNSEVLFASRVLILIIIALSLLLFLPGLEEFSYRLGFR